MSTQHVEIVSIAKTAIWVEDDLLGARHVVAQHEGCEPFTYATFHYHHYYTDNASTHRAADSLALQLGAVEPVEHKARPFQSAQPSPQPAVPVVSDEQIDEIIERTGEAVGMHHGAWDMVNPRELVRAIITLSTANENQPQVVSVGDTRFEGWLGCHEPDRNVGRALRYSKQDMRDSYWAGYCEYRAILALRPQAVPTDVEKLLRGIGEVTQKAGIYNGEVRLTGPLALHLLNDMANALLSGPQAVPMTPEQMRAILTEAGYDDANVQARADFINGARYAERHHGITAKAEGGA